MIPKKILEIALDLCNESPKPLSRITQNDGTQLEGTITSVKGILPVVVVWVKTGARDEAVLIESIKEIAKIVK